MAGPKTDPNMAMPSPGESELQPNTREEAARLLHDLSTPLLTLRAVATRIPDEGSTAGLQQEIDTLLNRISDRLDSFWQQTSGSPARRSTADTPLKDARASQVPLHILLVDDDDIHRDIGVRLLTKLGHTVTPCDNINDTASLCAETRFDMILMDQHGPGLLGSDVARRFLTEMPSVAPRWIIGMSSDPRHSEMRARCLAAGMQDYLEKPITLEKLETALSHAFHQQASAD
ncbi:response regulator [Kordiimonas marina]|uniref:response regulator n=1 Tax=Kordiimonas marina TaxID=2872312 RepID=UPI001FF136CF|nr:response regulator [Kordiimonas marina]MCJ9428050.1 response regulator [Kordiimonas marina]